MKKEKRVSQTRVVWGKIRYYQAIYQLSEEEIAKSMSVLPRTLKDYDKDAQHLTLGQLDNFLSLYNLNLIELLSM